MKAEQEDHASHDGLVSPRQVLPVTTGIRTEVQGPRERRDGEDGERKELREGKEGERKAGLGKEEGDDPLNAALSCTVRALGGDLLEVKETGGEDEEQRVIEEDEPIDQHPDKGLISGSSGDGLGQDMATEEINEDGRPEEGEEARVPRKLPSPTYVSKAEREEHELTHTPYRSWCDHCVRCRGRNVQHRKKEDEDRKGQFPRIFLDYFFINHQDEAANENPMLIMVEETQETNTRAP